jgi:hypothetical protein
MSIYARFSAQTIVNAQSVPSEKGRKRASFCLMARASESTASGSRAFHAGDAGVAPTNPTKAA